MADGNMDLKRIAGWIEGIRVAMLTTIGPEGALHSRPMATQEAPFDGEVWFFTNDSSPKIAELLQDRHVNVAYADNHNHRYVSLTGQASLVRNRARIEELWKPHLKAWFPEGLEDPHLALIRVRVESAEYWSSPSSPVVHALGLAKALITGKRAQGGENEKIDLKQSA